MFLLYVLTQFVTQVTRHEDLTGTTSKDEKQWRVLLEVFQRKYWFLRISWEDWRPSMLDERNKVLLPGRIFQGYGVLHLKLRAAWSSTAGTSGRLVPALKCFEWQSASIPPIRFLSTTQQVNYDLTICQKAGVLFGALHTHQLLLRCLLAAH